PCVHSVPAGSNKRRSSRTRTIPAPQSQSPTRFLQGSRAEPQPRSAPRAASAAAVAGKLEICLALNFRPGSTEELGRAAALHPADAADRIAVDYRAKERRLGPWRFNDSIKCQNPAPAVLAAKRRILAVISG